MQAYHLPKQESLGLRRIILLERAREESLNFITAVADAMVDPMDQSAFAEHIRDNIVVAVTNNMVNTINSVFLDNLMRFVVTKDTLPLVAGMQGNTLGAMMEVGHRHYAELVNDISAEYETEQEVRLLIGNYVNYIYLNNKQDIDMELLKVFEVLYTSFGHMQISSSRFVFGDNGRPCALISGGVNEVSQAY